MRATHFQNSVRIALMADILVHRSDDRDLKIRPETKHGVFNQRLFFCWAGEGDLDLTDPEKLQHLAACSYTPGTAKEVYVMTVDSYIHASNLVPDAIAEEEIAHIWGADIDAWDALRGDLESEMNEGVDGEGGWYIQRIRAELANRMGYEAVVDWDEQGVVWIVDFTGRNEELNARLRHVGNYEDIRE